MYIFHYTVCVSRICANSLDYARNTLLFDDDEGFAVPYGLRPTESVWMVPDTVPVDEL